MQPAILRYVWDQYDTLHKVLLDWLRELGHHASFEIRTRAAAAVGELAKEDFGYIHRHVILPWAKDENSQLRQAAAFALGVPVWEGTLAPQVLGLLHHWSTLPNNWGLCWTAATAYGGLVGLRFPDMALRDLCAIAEHGNPRLLGVLTGSMATLFEAGRLATDYYFKVLDALLAWTSQSRNQTLTPTGLFIYLMLTLNAKVEAEPEGDPWPTLLWLAKENETARKSVISLWRRALNTKSTRQLALTALQQWQYSVDNDSRLYDTQEQIIVELATQGQPHERKRLLSYLKRWATHSRKASPSAGKILKTLHNS